MRLETQVATKLEQPLLPFKSPENPMPVHADAFTTARAMHTVDSADVMQKLGLRFVPHKVEMLPSEKYFVESLSSAEITPQLVAELSDFYRFTFNNENEHYLIYPSTGEFISPKEIFGQDNVPTTVMDAFSDYPKHPQTGEQSVVFHDPQVTYEKLLKLLSKNAYLVVLRDAQTLKVSGMTFEYKASLEEIFRNEWQDPLTYSPLANTADGRSFEDFLKHMQLGFSVQGISQEVSPQMEFYCWNCTVTAPDARGLDNVLVIISRLHLQVLQKENSKNIFAIFETQQGKMANKGLKNTGAFEIPNVFNDNTVLMVARLQEIFDNYSLSPNDFKRLCLQKMRAERQKMS
jgi:hypothetical protein